MIKRSYFMKWVSKEDKAVFSTGIVTIKTLFPDVEQVYEYGRNKTIKVLGVTEVYCVDIRRID